LLSVGARLTNIFDHLNSVMVTKHKVVVCRDLGPDAMPLLRQRSDLELVVWEEDSSCDTQWLLENITGSSGLVVTIQDKVTDELLEIAGPNLKVVSTMSVGYDHIDLSAVARRGIRLGYTPDVLTDAVADLAVLLALMAGRGGKETMLLVQNGQWPAWSPFPSFSGPQISVSPISPLSPEPRNRTVGFLGFGRTARATLARLVPFGITRCIYSSNPSSFSAISASSIESLRSQLSSSVHTLESITAVSLNTLAKESDVLFILAPGGASTYHIINEDFLRKMKPTSILINPSRGTLVDSDALAKALREHWIWGAGVDVVEGEPNVGTDHPLVKEPRCVVLPHIGSATAETRSDMARLAAQNLIAGITGDKMLAEVELSSHS